MTWPTFRTEAPFQELEVTSTDMNLATLAFGWTLGFGYFVAWHAFKLTRRRSTFINMCWLEIVVSVALAIICWLYICGVIKHSFWFYFMTVTIWALQVQFLLQIIVNRICILLPTPNRRFWLKFIVAVWIGAINVSVYCIWIPAKLQISRHFHDINVWWDRTEKCLYLVTDGVLNYMFIRSIKKRLVSVGLKKYDELVKFNEKIIAVSLSMDILIIIMMSYRNDLVYLQFHPVAYLVKLEIEMCMSSLMVKVATGTGIEIYDDEPDSSLSRSKSLSDQTSRRAARESQSVPAVNVQVVTQTVTHTDHISMHDEEFELEGHKYRTPTNDWRQETSMIAVNSVGTLDAQDDDTHSVASNKRHTSWCDINRNQRVSSVTVITTEIDLEHGRPEIDSRSA
ncbi:hypothetical protein RhiLY_00343 [Ceratobasidium sp. AG-Ba]|nr:hypothetical protein RhiLY_00343 [Ceratobasidium sp. AG-Ba]